MEKNLTEFGFRCDDVDAGLRKCRNGKCCQIEEQKNPEICWQKEQQRQR